MFSELTFIKPLQLWGHGNDWKSRVDKESAGRK